ncbi:uncharacterized protein [Rutidosis leptorrhynchoides]|uniref:uncharacterized protein n=1 Tax=Rutidosis leptorrhynchoides TaxID=125765 RepID=UPI003A9A5403
MIRGCSHATRTISRRQIFDISFTSKDPVPKNAIGDEPLLIKAEIGGAIVHRIYVDGGSSTEIMYDHCFQLLNDTQKATMQPPTTPLVGFAGQQLWPMCVITLSLTLNDYQGKGNMTIKVEFMVVRAPSPYNVILGRTRLNKLGAIASTIHLLIKFPIPSGIATVLGDTPCIKGCMHTS